MLHIKIRAGYFCWRSRLCGWLCLLPLLLGTGGATAQDSGLRIGNQDRYALSRSFTYLEDGGAALTLQQVLAPDAQARFRSTEQGSASTNFGATHSAIWLRVRLEVAPDAPRRWLLEVANPPLDRLDLYVSNTRGTYDHQAGGDLLPFTERATPHRNHVELVELEPGGVTMLYLRIASQGTVSAPTTLWQPAALWQHDQQTYASFGLYFGLLIGLFLYNLLLFLSVRDPAYLIYVVFVACIGLSQAANSGLGAQFLWPHALWWNNNSINATNAASGTFGMLFARSFLASRVKMPRLDLWMRLQVGLWVLALLLVSVLPYRMSGRFVTDLALVGVLTVAAAAAISVRRQHSGAKYFAFAWAGLLLGVVAQAMHNNGFLPSNAFTANALLIGSAFEMVLLSFALADRINVARRDAALAQSRMISEQAMVHALQQSQERYRAVIEHVAEGMVVVQDRRIVFVNFRATEMLEASKEEIVANGVADRINVDDRALMAERVQRRLAGQDVPERCQVRLELPGKPVKWLEVGDATVPWDGGQGLLVFFLDVTQRHKAEMDTRTALDRQQELNDLRSRFVAMTSHEFRTPLATILSSQDLLKHYNDRLPEAERQELLGIIETGVHRMTRMLDRVLLLGKAEAHMLEFKPRQLDLKALCKDLVAEAVNQQPEGTCHVAMECADLPPDGLYDEKLLRHIFSNLLSNAIKYSPEGGEVALKIFADGTQTVFEVSDRGIGIPPDEMGHLFESFHRASNVGDIKGTGLGLAIVKNAVDLHGGTIDVRGNEGQGTVFTVRLDGTGQAEFSTF